MDYEGRICRAPMQRSAFMLPVVVGCPYNRCKFCDLFQDLTFRKLPVSQIEAELLRVKDAGGSPKKVFLGDGNAFVLNTHELIEILDLIRSYFPGVSEINCDASIVSVARKSDMELRGLAERGMRHLYIGIESGLDDVLRFMNKDHGNTEAKRQIRRLKEAGLVFDAHFMTGVAGRGRGLEDAEALAEFFNETQPDHIVNFSIFLSSNTGLYPHIKDGSFLPADEVENMEQELRLLERIQPADGHVISYDGFHDFIEVRTRGILPKDREKMLIHLRKQIEVYREREPVYSLTGNSWMEDGISFSGGALSPLSINITN